MRIVENPGELEEAVKSAKREVISIPTTLTNRLSTLLVMIEF